MSKTSILKGLRIDDSKTLFFVCIGSGMSYRCFGAATSLTAAKTLRADIRRNPQAYGID